MGTPKYRIIQYEIGTDKWYEIKKKRLIGWKKMRFPKIGRNSFSSTQEAIEFINRYLTPEKETKVMEI